MASPVVEATAETAVSTAGTSHAITLPAGITATDVVLLTMDIGSTAATLNALTGWTEILDENLANGLKVVWYTGGGVPTNPTFTTSAATRSATIAWRISNAALGITPQIGTTATGTSLTPDPPASATPPSTKDYLFIAFAGMAGEEADDDTWGNTSPTNYTPSPPLQKACGIAGTNLGGLILAASRQLTTGTAENPGTFNVDVSAAWRAQTVTIHPAPPPTQSPVARLSLAAATTPDTRTAHSIKARVRKQSGTGQVTLRAALYEGVTNRSGDLESSALTTSLANYTLAIPDASAANITSYANLELRFWGYSSTADTVVVEVAEIWLEIPGTTSTGAALTLNIDDTLTVADSSFNSPNKISADTLTVADASAKDAVLLKVDTIAVTDSLSWLPGLAVGDAIGVADSILAEHGFAQAVNDSIGVADATIIGFGAFKNDALAVVDALAQQIGHVESDALVVADATALQVSIFPADSLTVADSTQVNKGAAQAVDDTLAVTDAQSLEAGKAVSDAIAVTDAESTQATHVQADSLTVSDATGAQPGVNVADSLTVADAQATSWGASQPVADAIGVADAVSKEPNVRVNDSITVADAVTKQPNVVVIEALSVADQWSFNVTTVVADSLTVQDDMSPSTNGGIVINDSLLVSDATSRAVAALRADSIAVADATSAQPTIAVIDSLAVTDAVSEQVQKFISDGLTVTDAVALAVTHALVDAVAVADATQVDLVRMVVVADTLSITDTTVKAIATSLSDAIDAQDLTQLEPQITLADALDVADDVAGETARTGLLQLISDSLAVSDAITPLQSAPDIILMTMVLTAEMEAILAEILADETVDMTVTPLEDVVTRITR